VKEMTQNIICKRRKLIEEDEIENELEEVYGKSNLKDAIHLDLLKEMI
jgi:hypothetical protein